MKTKLQLAALALALSAVNSPLSTTFAQGSLTPPAGAPAPVMKSLDQVEARTAITNTSSAVVISQPGSYYLTGNLTVSSGSGISINTNGVTLDLNGFTIRSTAAVASGYGILLNGALSDITILNGHIRGSVTNNGSGVYGGGGFNYGIYYSTGPLINIHVSHLSVSGVLFYGIMVSDVNSTIVEFCTVQTAGNWGIYASTVKNCTALDCGSQGITANQASDSRGECSGNNSGIFADAALNCSGKSKGGSGISATTASNCIGTSTSGTGLGADAALNCFGTSTSGIGLFANKTATGCIGNSTSNTGLSAFIANSCSGTSLSVTHNVNSF